MGDKPASIKKRRKIQFITRGAVKRLTIGFVVGGLALGAFLKFAVDMPGSGFSGPLPELTQAQHETARRLEADVTGLVDGFVGRSTMSPAKYAAAAQHLRASFESIGLEAVLETFEMQHREGRVSNVVAEIAGTVAPKRMLIVGAHYDAHLGLPGADDNASGVAGVLELARRFKAEPADCTVRFVLFANEEPPHFMTEDMGSYAHAAGCQERGDDVIAMLSLEMIGYFDAAAGSQRYPFPLSMFYPDTGDFIAFVGDVGSGGLVRRATGIFRETTEFPSEGVALPSGIPGIGYSDHWSFWQHGYKALMVTDTSFYRNPHYHTSRDVPDTLDFDSIARVVDGIEQVVRGLAEQER